MKTRTLIAVAVIVLTLTYCAIAAGPATNSVTLAWSPSPDSTVTSYRIYSSTNASSPLPWTLTQTVQSTQTNVTFFVSKASCFYYVTAVATVTNSGIVIERESDPSNVALDPWPNQGYGLKITK